MALSNTERQKAFQVRRSTMIENMRDALNRIIVRLDGNDKPLAVELREIAKSGLPKSEEK
jgi:hypothetical protein